MMRARLAACVLAAGCASGQASQTVDGSTGQTDGMAYLDGKIEGQGDAPHVTPAPDAAIDALVYQDACVPVVTELLANPVFDLTPMGASWTQVPIDSTYPPITSDTNVNGGFVAQTMPYKAWLGGFIAANVGQYATDVVYQDFAVPANTTQLRITGVYEVGSDETGSTVYDTASLQLQQTNGTPIETVVSLTNASGTNDTWVAIDHVFSATSAGQTVRLRMTSSNDFSNSTSFLFDTLSIKATHCP